MQPQCWLFLQESWTFSFFPILAVSLTSLYCLKSLFYCHNNHKRLHHAFHFYDQLKIPSRHECRVLSTAVRPKKVQTGTETNVVQYNGLLSSEEISERPCLVKPTNDADDHCARQGIFCRKFAWTRKWKLCISVVKMNRAFNRKKKRKAHFLTIKM